jgi:hypothetical protein
MAETYATVASATPVTPATPMAPGLTANPIDDILTMLKKVTTPPDALRLLIESLRCEMEIPQTVGFRGSGTDTRPTGPSRTFDKGKPTNAWKSGTGRFGSMDKGRPDDAPWHSHARPAQTQSTTGVKPSPGRYQSRFTSGNEGMDGKILNSIIGNKLNAFTETTYNDTRDFIYQIMDSGETDFIKDFVEKVFTKATVEELFCGLFAKLIAEIAQKYTGMYVEMQKYHNKFLEIFDDVEDHAEAEYAVQVKKKQYRMGYGHFLSELAGQNALEKSQLLGMIEKLIGSVWTLSVVEGKTKTVEEFIDCLIRLITSLKQKSKPFFLSVKGDMIACMMDKMEVMIDKKNGVRPSLSVKGRFGLMDLRDLIVDT